MKQVIALAFDGVIHRYSKGWHDGSIYDEPSPGVKEFIVRQRKRYRVLIYSTRFHDREVDGMSQPNQVEEVINWLNEHTIPFDQVWARPGLPPAVAYVDKKAIRFTGDWAAVEKEIGELV